jgi:hypothetical protein
MVRIRLAAGSMKRAAALAGALLALLPSVSSAAPLQRLTVTAFSLSADTAKPQIEVPFHLIVTLHVREAVAQIDNINLPVLVDVELYGDERRTQAGPGGTDYRETITVVAHHTGKIVLAPVTLQCIDARDGKAKQYSTNPLTLDVVGGALEAPGVQAPSLQDAAANVSAFFRSIGAWIAGFAVIVLLIVLLARRPPAPLPVAASVAVPVAHVPAPSPPPVRSIRDRMQDALTVLRADPTRATAVRVRSAVWESIGASPGETLTDVLRRPASNEERMSNLLRALERAAFTYDDDLGRAIDGACQALERYLA